MDTLEARVFRLKANAELQRIMAAYCNYLSGAQFEKILTLFSNEQEDVRVQTLWGVYEGYTSLGRLYCGLMRELLCGGGDALLPGVLNVYGVNTPTISVAEDGQTARGLWVGPGMATVKDDNGPNGLQSYWVWQKLGADFVYENDAWKIWHLHVYDLFTTPFEVSWVENCDAYSAPIFHGKFAPDRAGEPDAKPLPPVPYTTFSAENVY